MTKPTVIAVLGASGMLGSAVTQFLKQKGHQVLSLQRADYDCARDPIERFQEVLRGAESIINCAGIIKQSIQQYSIEDVLRVNVLLPHNLSVLAQRSNLRCIHISTDCAYSGKRGQYSEADLFDAGDVYGLSKIGGESSTIMTIRTSIIGEHPSEGTSLLEWARRKTGTSVDGFANHYWNGLSTPYLAETIENILNLGLYHEGIFHLHSPNTVSKYDLLVYFNRYYDLNLHIRKVDATTRCDRSLTSIFPLAKHLVVKTIEEQVADMPSFFSDN